MSRLFFALAFALGTAVVTWIGLGFRESAPLALGITLLITVVYGLGFAELVAFRRATRQLSRNLAQLPQQPDQLESWLAGLPEPLRHPVRRKLEGHTAALPGPQLTPYLSGLLVMLGLLGTFGGMIVTLNGAASALGGSTELSVIRGALAEPIAGLSLAFGTSIAGVAASAMLGLAATISRRDRVLASRQLDLHLRQHLHHLSTDHQRLQAYDAMTSQAQVLPELVEAMQAMTRRMDQLGETLTGNQQDFHRQVSDQYQQLAKSVDQSLQQALDASSRLAVERIEPLVNGAMNQLRDDADALQQRWNSSAEQQLSGVVEAFRQVTTEAGQQWQENLQSQQSASADQTRTLQQDNLQHRQQLQDQLQQWLTETRDNQQQWTEQNQQQLSQLAHQLQEASEQTARLWQNGLEQQQQTSADHNRALLDANQQQRQQLQDQTQQWLAELQQDQKRWLEQSQAQLTQLGQQLQGASEQTTQHWQRGLDHQQQAGEALIARLHQAMEEQQTRFQEQANELLSRQDNGLAALTSRVGEQLTALHDQEAKHSELAVKRLSSLEETVTRHLSELGTALEAPMTRLIETASETPRAAAEVIRKLQDEMATNSERENQLLEERQRLVEQLDSLLENQRTTADAQRRAVDALIQGAGDTLATVSDRFSTLVQNQGEQLGQLSDHVAGSGQELGALGEAFQLAMELFSQSNNTLVDSLSRIQQALDQASSRHDEQLAYYVAQAREVIDLSISSQQEVVDAVAALRREQADAAGATS